MQQICFIIYDYVDDLIFIRSRLTELHPHMPHEKAVKPNSTGIKRFTRKEEIKREETRIILLNIIVRIKDVAEFCQHNQQINVVSL